MFRKKTIKPISIEKQIDIVKNIIKYKEYKNQGLCTCFKTELWKRGYIPNQTENKVKYYIPLFCYKNALLYGKAVLIIRKPQYSFWWSKFDSDKRLKFLEWILKKLNKQINK